MKRLIEAGLHGGGLLALDRSELLARYNACLLRLGIPRTTREQIHIDALGWSPEVAEELKNRHYLSAGPASPFAIIVSPAQEGLPLYCPLNSYDRELLRGYFSRFRGEIADITTTDGICLDMDCGLASFRAPRDLLLIDYVIVRSSAGVLSAAAERQKELLRRFHEHDLAWFDAVLRSEIVESSRLHGDLRFRHVSIPSFKFDALQCFHTCALGGAFVLRRERHARKLIVLEDESQTPAVDILQISDPQLPQCLRQEHWITISSEYYREHPEELERKREYLLAEAVCDSLAGESYVALTRMQRKKRFSMLGEDAAELMHSFERCMRAIEAGRDPGFDSLPPQLQLLLARPSELLSPEQQQVVSLLLARLCPADIERLYRFDKQGFYAEYRNWKEARQEWAIECLVTSDHFKKNGAGDDA